MTDTVQLPPLATLKQQAKRLRAGLAEDGDFISHSESLELVARQYGYRDWNTLFAEIGNQPQPRFTPGARVAGRYLGQPFAGEIVAMRLQAGERTKVTVRFDAPVDVVAFDSFSAYRSRVTVTVDANGETREKTSNGAPLLAFKAD